MESQADSHQEGAFFMPYEALTAPLTLRGKTLKTRLLYFDLKKK